jgi:hypothetical protein
MELKTFTLRSLKTVDVRELSWREYLAVVKRLTDTVFKVVGKDINSLSKAKELTITLEPKALISAISEQEDLVAWLVEKTTGLKQDEISKLSPVEVMPLLGLIVEMNLTPEHVAAGKALAGQMGAIFGVLKTGSPEQSTPSSRPATT